jgi:iron complex outermembrane recepter protein
MKKIISFTLALFTAISLVAQMKINISGQLQDNNQNLLPYASIIFINTENENLNDAVLCDANGKFEIQIIPGRYQMTLEAVNTPKQSLEKTFMKNTNLGFITLTDNNSPQKNTKEKVIDEVVVKATKSIYKVEIDKKVYSVDQDLTVKGGNLQDILNNVPSVNVDVDGSVSMRGNSNIRILINGKPSSMFGNSDDASAMRAIPADMIEKVEVITNPSAKYEAAGTAGILNIILKKTKVLGFNGSVEGTLGYLPRTGLNTNLNWTKGNYSWFVNGGGGYRENKSTMNTDTYYKQTEANSTNPNKELSLIQRGITNSINQNYNANTGLSIELNPKNTINVGATIYYFENESKANIVNTAQNLMSSTEYNRRSVGNATNRMLSAEAGYEHKFEDTGHLLTSNLSIQNFVNHALENIHDEFQQKDFILKNNSDNRLFFIKTDYELPLGDAAKLEAGHRFDMRNNITQNYYAQQINNLSITDANNSNMVDYKDKINAAYLNYKNKTNKLAYQAGLRSEWTLIDIDYASYGQSNQKLSREFINFFPSVFFTYDVAENHQLLLNYSRRINRPDGWRMTPIRRLNNDRNTFVGNASLMPEYINSFEFGYLYNTKKLSINPSLYYQRSTDDITVVTTIENALTPQGDSYSIINTMPMNASTMHKYGLELTSTYNPLPFLKFLANVNAFAYQNNPYIANLPSSNGIAVNAKINTTLMLSKTFNLQIQDQYSSVRRTLNNTSKAVNSMNIGMNKTFANGNFILTFNVQDVFNTRARMFINDTPEFNRDLYMQMQPRQFSLSLTYKFKNEAKQEKPVIKDKRRSDERGMDYQDGGGF